MIIEKNDLIVTIPFGIVSLIIVIGSLINIYLYLFTVPYEVTINRDHIVLKAQFSEKKIQYSEIKNMAPDLRIDIGKDRVHNIMMQPLSSWSTSHGTAMDFARGEFGLEGSEGMIFGVTVPASDVLGCARTGFGCLNEFEYVLLDAMGPSNMEWVRY